MLQFLRNSFAQVSIFIRLDIISFFSSLSPYLLVPVLRSLFILYALATKVHHVLERQKSIYQKRRILSTKCCLHFLLFKSKYFPMQQDPLASAINLSTINFITISKISYFFFRLLKIYAQENQLNYMNKTFHLAKMSTTNKSIYDDEDDADDDANST